MKTWTWLAAMLLLPASAVAQLNITILHPTNLVANLTQVAVQVNGGDAGASVTASIGGVVQPLSKGTVCRPTNLDPPPCIPDPAWLGVMDLSSLPSGPFVLVVTASDGVGGTYTASRNVTLDRVPVITVASPTPRAATWTQARIAATCADDFGCVSIRAQVGAATLISGTTSIDGVVDLAAYDGQMLHLVFIAQDTFGSTVSRTVQFFVEGSPNVHAVAKVPGEILDASADRFLYRRGASLDELVIRDRATSAETVVNSGSEIQRSGLTNAGAAFTVFQNYGNVSMSTSRSWESGTVVPIGTPPCCFITTNGSQVVWMEDSYRIWWRSPAGATTTEVAPTSSNHGATGMSLRPAPGGALGFFDGLGALKLFSPVPTPGVQTLLPAEGCRWGNPRTDGSTVAFETGPCNARKVRSIKDGSVRAILDAGQFDSVSYDVAGGWVGASRAYLATLGQVVRVDPQGNVTSIPPPANSQQLLLEKIHSDGTLSFLDQKRYVSPPSTSQAHLVGSSLGRGDFISGALHVALGDTLFAYRRAAPYPEKAYHHFGFASMGTGTPGVPVMLTNDTTAPVTVTGISTTANFTATHDCATLAPAQQCTVLVTFRPGPVTAPLNARVDLGGELTVASTAMATPYRVSLWGIGERSLVRHYYQSILGRAPDSGGQSFWEGEATRVSGLGADVNEAWFAMAMSFFASAEYNATARTTGAYVTNLYNTFFSRAPDAGGLAYWSGQVDSGLPREVALTAFMFSPEFTGLSRAVFGTSPARAETDMVVDFYRGILGRLPDSSGFNFWLGRFRAAQCQDAAAVRAEVESISGAFAGSSEYGARQRSNALFVADLYNAFLRRGGDLDGVSYWIGQLDAGARTREQLRREFMASPEFAARVNAVVTQGCAQ